MFFNTALKNELEATKEKLFSLEQVSEGIQKDLLTLTLDSSGKITSANEKFLSQLEFFYTRYWIRQLENWHQKIVGQQIIIKAW